MEIKYGLQEQTNIWITWNYDSTTVLEEGELKEYLLRFVQGDRTTWDIWTLREDFIKNGYVHIDGDYMCNDKYVIETYFWRPQQQPTIKISKNPDNDIKAYVSRFRKWNGLMKTLSEYPQPLSTY